MTLEKGQKIEIWEDPIIRNKLEGRATLLQRIDKGFDPQMQRWLVLFDGDHESPVTRFIMVDDEKENE